MCFVFTVPALAQQKIKDTTELGAAGKAKELIRRRAVLHQKVFQPSFQHGNEFLKEFVLPQRMLARNAKLMRMLQGKAAHCVIKRDEIGGIKILQSSLELQLS